MAWPARYSTVNIFETCLAGYLAAPFRLEKDPSVPGPTHNATRLN